MHCGETALEENPKRNHLYVGSWYGCFCLLCPVAIILHPMYLIAIKLALVLLLVLGLGLGFTLGSVSVPIEIATTHICFVTIS